MSSTGKRTRLEVIKEVGQLRKEMNQASLIISALYRILQKVKYDQSSSGFTVTPDGKALVRRGATGSPDTRYDAHLRRISNFSLIPLSVLVDSNMGSNILSEEQ